jgi:outer membrane protein OmpA-like peptidoglycan-associated protein
MKMKQHPLFTMLTALVLLPKLATATEIRQEEFRYAMNLAQDVACTTFVITDMPRSGKLAVVGCRPPMVHFHLGSAFVASAEAESLMTGLRTCRFNKNTPLIVTGHSCIIGPEQINQELSLQRAKAVAGLLLASGFTVTEVSGRGSGNPLTNDSEQFYLNRRVEISPASDKNENSPASRGR